MKADGSKVAFNPNKIITTCLRAGANKEATKRIIKKIRGQVYQGVETHDIYKMVLNALNEEKEGTVLKQRYKLKEAIMKLGPTGFLFENYVGEILKHSEFKVKTISGKVRVRCTVHEIDLIAFSGNKRTLVECKHHSKHGVYTGLKESLYTHARFLDTKSSFESEYLICNTKVSMHAKKYAKCVGQHILSWKYPPNNSLEKIIEKNHLYPITILSLNSKEIRSCLHAKILLAKNLLNYREKELSKKTGINTKRISNLQKLVQQMIS
ncbi:MAG: ATP cone domain-containing protein [Nitrosopumilus sp.]